MTAGSGLLLPTLDELVDRTRPGVLGVLRAADAIHSELAVTHDAIAAAAGFYDCPCGSAFELGADWATLEDYAALNRWVGLHVGSACGGGQ